MGRSEYDDGQGGGFGNRDGKRRKRFEHDDGGHDHRQKRSGKRFHRKKTFKDDNWPGEESLDPSKHF